VTDPVVLAIESATSCVGCAVGSSDGVMAAAWSTRGRRHAESLAPQIEFVLDQAGLRVGDLDALAVDVGPGLYTGLRVGVTTARAMAHALGVPVVAVSSLDAVAHVNRAGGDTTVVLDARRGEVYHATYTTDGTNVVATEARVGPVGDLPDTAPRRVVGDGVAPYGDALRAAGFVIDPDAPAIPRPDAVLELAVARVDDAAAPAEIRPRYLRRPDAVAKWEGA
jgi:tRNA threonylcarbamoyladenosine biosynthesis protein TsaB